MKRYCLYPPVCSPEAKILARLLSGERIKMESPDASNRTPLCDLIETLNEDYGWLIFVYHGPVERFEETQRQWAIFEVDSALLELNQPRASSFIKAVDQCKNRKCICTKGFRPCRQ